MTDPSGIPGDEPPQDPYGRLSGPPPYAQPSGPPPYGQQPQYGQQPPYGGPPYGQPQGFLPGAYAPDHPRATMSLVLGILGIVVCGILAPFAWWIGKRTLGEIDGGVVDHLRNATGAYDGAPVGLAEYGRVRDDIAAAVGKLDHLRRIGRPFR